MTQILLALLTLSLPILGSIPLMTGAASAQQRTVYDARGNVVGRSATDSSGATTNYDARGKVDQPRVHQRHHDDRLRSQRSQRRQGHDEPLNPGS